MNGPRDGLLLINLGTPNAPTPAAVGTYLREFLMDGRVINIPRLLRWFLVNIIIVPFRKYRSSHAYEKVWSAEGSPLMLASRGLQKAVQERVGPDVPVVLGMRYGQPSIESAVMELVHKGVERIVVFPLYPQHASASTGTVVEEVLRVTGKLWFVPTLHFVESFYDDPGFIAAQVKRAETAFGDERPDHLLISFHGLPEEHVQLGDLTQKHCLASPDCCDRIGPANRLCYRAHCVATARELAKGLGLNDDQWSISFQSRLGRKPWLKPYTDLVIDELIQKRNVKHLAVVSPAFVADCLETLEELGISLREDFLAKGGTKFTLIPCVNDHPIFADAVTRLARSSGWLTAAKPLPVLSAPRPIPGTSAHA